MNCPTLMVMICMYCGAEYERKDGKGVSGESHGICYQCVKKRKDIMMEQIGPDKEYWLTGRILQKIYDSEIHLSIGWMWDGGVDYSIGKDLSYLHDGKIDSTGITNISTAVRQIADEVAKEYPESTFTKWWTEVR